MNYKEFLWELNVSYNSKTNHETYSITIHDGLKQIAFVGDDKDDAYLIRAAPELYEALRHLLSSCQIYMPKEKLLDFYQSIGYTVSVEAIKKAEGKL